MKKNKRTFKKGQIYLVNSIAGVKHLAKVIRPEGNEGFIGSLVNEKDSHRLCEAGVPKLNMGDEFFVFDYEVIRRINNTNRKQKTKSITRKKR